MGTEGLFGLVRQWLRFPLSILGGVVAACLMWVLILVYTMWQLSVRARDQGDQQLGAVSGG
jgi:hypothetical protein